MSQHVTTCHNMSQYVTRQVSMTSSSCEADVHNWDDRKDDLSGALDHAEKAALMGRRGQALTECEQKNYE